MVCYVWCRIKWRSIQNCDPHMVYYMWYWKINWT